MSGNVHAFNQRPTVNLAAFEEISKTLSVVNWSIQVQVILNAAGIPAGSELAEDPNTPLSQGTNAHGFGHDTLGSFIKSGRDKFGLGMEWSAWVNQAKAHRYKQSFNIYSENVEEIISQVNDISKVMKRMPVSAAEYHQHKDNILQTQKRDTERRAKLQTNEMNERIVDLMRSLEKEKTTSANLQQQATETQAKLDAALHDMESKLDAARTSHNLDLERRLIAQRTEIETAFRKEIDALRQQAEMRLNESNERLEEMQRHYAENFVSKSDHEVVTEQLNRARDENFGLIRQLTDSRRQLDETLSTLEAVEKAYAAEQAKTLNLTSEVERLSVRMNAIVLAPTMGGDNSEHVAELQRNIDDLMGKLEISGNNNSQMMRERQALQRKLDLYKERLNQAISSNKTLKFKLKKANTSVKIKVAELRSMKKNMWVLSATLGCSVLFAGILIATV